MQDTNLSHYGVLGMHWGRKLGGGLTKNTRKKAAAHNSKLEAEKVKKLEGQSEDHKKKVALKQKKISQLSNVELKSLNDRLQLEKTYKELKKHDLSPGKKMAKDIIENAAKETLKNALAKGMTKGVEAAVKYAVK